MLCIIAIIAVLIPVSILTMAVFKKPAPRARSLLITGVDGKTTVLTVPPAALHLPLATFLETTPLGRLLTSTSAYLTAGSRRVDPYIPASTAPTILRISPRLRGGGGDTEDIMVAMLVGTDMRRHGDKVSAGLVRFYKYTTLHARLLAEAAYPWLVDMFRKSPDFDALWFLQDDGLELPQIVPRVGPLSLHPAILGRFADPSSGTLVSGLQMLLAIALTVNPDLDAPVKVAVQSGTHISTQPKLVRMVTMPGARKSHGTGVYLLRFNATRSVLIGAAVTSTFKDRLDTPVYSASPAVVAAASAVDQRRDRDDFILFDLECYSDSIPQLAWLSLALKTLCIVMFGAATPGRGLNPATASTAADFARLQILWQQVLGATSAGARIYPHRPGTQLESSELTPDATGPGTFSDFYERYLVAVAGCAVGPCFALLRTLSGLADTGDYDAFPPLRTGAWMEARPAPRGLVGDAAPREPPTVGYRDTFKRDAPVFILGGERGRTRGRSRSPATPPMARAPYEFAASEMLAISEADEPGQ